MHIMASILFLAACGLSFCIGRCFSKLKAITILDELITNLEITQADETDTRFFNGALWAMDKFMDKFMNEL